MWHAYSDDVTHQSNDLRHAHCADIFTLFTLIFNVFVDFDTNSVDFYDSSLENVYFRIQRFLLQKKMSEISAFTLIMKISEQKSLNDTKSRCHGSTGAVRWLRNVCSVHSAPTPVYGGADHVWWTHAISVCARVCACLCMVMCLCVCAYACV